MESVALLVVAGIVLQAFGWFRYRRDTRFWVFGKGLRHHLHPTGVALFVLGQLSILAGILLYLRTDA